MTTQPHVTIYTDGGASPNPGPGGWAARLIGADGTIKDLSGSDPHTTNNRMELTAATEALRALKQPCVVTLYTDSTYLKQGITRWLPTWIARNWQRSGDQPVKNQDLWQALAAQTRQHDITWEWVKGHAGDEHNEAVDQLATQAREALTESAPSPTPANSASNAAYEIALRVSAPSTSGRGGWAIRLDRTGPIPDQQTLTGSEAGASANRLELLAALAALQTPPPGESLRVFCPSDYLYKGMTDWLAGWQRSGWKTAGGKPVQNRDLWEQLAQQAAQRPVSWEREGKPQPAIAQGLDKLAAQAAADPR